MSQHVAAVLNVPINVVHTLVKSEKEAAALLETTFQGQNLQQLMSLQSCQQGCDVSQLHKLCTTLLSSGHAALAAPVPAVMQTAAAITQAADAVQQQVGECLRRLAALSQELRGQAETNHTIATELARQPSCQELALERRLLARLQLELAERAAHVAQARGHCSLPPFAHAVEAFKADAAAQFRALAAQRQQMTSTQVNHAGGFHQHSQQQPALKGDLQVLAQGLQAVAAQVQQLVQAQHAQQATPTLQWGRPPAPSPPAAAAGPRIQEISPGGGAVLASPELVDGQHTKQQQQEAAVQLEQRKPRDGLAQQQQQEDAPAAAVQLEQRREPLDGIAWDQEEAAPGQEDRRGKMRSLRGDAAPSVSSEGAEPSPNVSQPPAAPPPQRLGEMQHSPSLWCPSQREITPLPRAACAPAALRAPPGLAAVAGCGHGGGHTPGEQPGHETLTGKENQDATQSQPSGDGNSQHLASCSQPLTERSSQQPRKGGSQPELPLTQPTEHGDMLVEMVPAEGDLLQNPACIVEEGGRQQQAQQAAAAAGEAFLPPHPTHVQPPGQDPAHPPRPAAVHPHPAAGIALGIFSSQRDSTSPASHDAATATDPASSGGKTDGKTPVGSGDSSGVGGQPRDPGPVRQQAQQQRAGEEAIEGGARAAGAATTPAVQSLMPPPPPPATIAGAAGKRAASQEDARQGKRTRFAAQALFSPADEPRQSEDPLPGQPTPGWHRMGMCGLSSAEGAAGLCTQQPGSPLPSLPWQTPALGGAARWDQAVSWSAQPMPALSAWDTPAVAEMQGLGDAADTGGATGSGPLPPTGVPRCNAHAVGGRAVARLTPGSAASLHHGPGQQLQTHHLELAAEKATAAAGPPGQTPCKGSNQLAAQAEKGRGGGEPQE